MSIMVQPVGPTADDRKAMGLEPTVEEQEQLAATRALRVSRMSTRERISTTILTLGFLLATAGLWFVDPPRQLGVPGALCSLVVMVLAMRVRFETPFGYTVATQLAFVPLMFALAPALVPIGACLAVLLATLPDVRAGRLAPGRLVRAVPNAWFALGPAWVFALTGVDRDGAVLTLLAALAAQFLVDFAASSLTHAVNHGAGLRSQLRETWVYGIDAALSGVGFVVAEQMRAAPYAVFAVVPLLGLLAMFAHERTERLRGLLELKETYRGTAMLLGDVVTADDLYTGLHSQGVVELAMSVGAALGLGPEDLRNLEFGALLHDVGKIAIPKAIINKPGKLDPDEWEIIKTHTVEGQRMLSRVGGFMTEVGEIVRSHHERWDGGGYPDGLRAEAAPLAARIITACDSWSAMRTDRPYRRALSHEQAVAEIVRHTGSQFDPRVAQALLTVVDCEPEPAPERRTLADFLPSLDLVAEIG